ncbi:ATP-dependent transcriptional regulator [Anaerolinea thermolimosa]|nr:ATP-dependent transcriptional regulator [Anaerolinea thermolimosa]
MSPSQESKPGGSFFIQDNNSGHSLGSPKRYNQRDMLSPLLISTKLVQPITTGVIPRPRLYGLLDTGVAQPLTLISAPPGFGKTMLVADWSYAHRQKDIAWLSLDESDNQLFGFWRYFISALRRLHPELGNIALELLSVPSPPAIEQVVATLINDLVEFSKELILVLDDYHQIQSLEIHNSLAFWLDHQPQNFHLIILTREDPPLGLARRRANRQMVEIRATDLRFTLEECEAFLYHVMGLQLTPQQVSLLEQATEGWIVGIQMAALSLQKSDAHAFFEAFSGRDRYIADYLIEEVLQVQSEKVRNFLLKTSILDRMSDSLCTALTGETDISLADLERTNLFVIALDTNCTWYRYHHLFADLLRQRLVATFPAEEIALLRRTASIWCESTGDILQAIRYAQQIPDAERVTHLLDRHVVLFFYQNELPQLVTLARTLPQEIRTHYPHLCMAIAWAVVALYQNPQEWLAEIERFFGQCAEAALSDLSLDQNRRSALLEVLIARLQSSLHDFTAIPQDTLRAIYAQFEHLPDDQVCLFNTVGNLRPVLIYNLGLAEEANGNLAQAVKHFRETVSLSRRLQNFHLLHFALGHLGNLEITQSHLQAARRTFEEALSELQAGSVSPYVCVTQVGLGDLHYEWGNLTEAEQYYREAVHVARLWNHWDSMVPALCGLARIRHRQGDTRAALDLLSELESVPFASMRLSIEALRVLWQAQRGECHPAEAWLTTNLPTLKAQVSLTAEATMLDAARLMLCIGQVETGTQLAQQLAETSFSRGHIRITIQARVVQARGLSLQGLEPEALSTLSEALKLAEPEHYLSSFLDEGEPLSALLAKLNTNPYALQLLVVMRNPMEHPYKRETGGLLTEREIDVLHLVSEGLTNQQIASHLVISLPTVKTHISNIYNKLGVENRTQAIKRAQDLGLIPRS